MTQAFSLPVYRTTLDVSNYSATFKLTVEIKGTTFEGEPRNNRNQVEMNATKVAYQHFEGSK
jgi:hypothetical protein